MRKRYFFIPLMVIIIIAGVSVWACKHPFGPGLFNLPIDEDNNISDNNDYNINPTLFNSSRKIPALTVTKNKVILATAGNPSGPITVKRSSNMGASWDETTVNGTISGVGYIHPFFINCHNGDILLGVISNKSDSKQTIIFRSSNNGESWTVETNISFSEICNDTANCFVTYGQGITLRHGNNGNTKLMFPYFYTNNNKADRYTATMLSTNDGKSFNNNYKDDKGKYSYGNFSTYETKFIELSDGNILLNMRTSKDSGETAGAMFWMLSTNSGKSWVIKTAVGNEENQKGKRQYAKHADFVRYEFDGSDIIKNNGDKYALMICSYENKNIYNIIMTTNDFNNGDHTGGTNKKYAYVKKLADSIAGGGYPAITVLPDGKIATLTEESSGIVFRKSTLSWLMGGN